MKAWRDDDDWTSDLASQDLGLRDNSIALNFEEIRFVVCHQNSLELANSLRHNTLWLADKVVLFQRVK